MRLLQSFALAAAITTAASAQLVPESFQVPRSYTGSTYKLVPLGPEVAKLDYDAYMGSIDHIRPLMGGNWPRPELTMADQTKDMAGEKAQWDSRKSFPYAVLNSDETKEYGCFYIRPSNKQGYDAVASLWTTKDQADKGFDVQLHKDMKAWLASAWPFTKVAWPGREIPQAEWRALPSKN
ncbi:MAG: twin-arginine translocation pathway signal protein [Bryobacteraceae bacterium]|nr:twin-arginine translocation pathway signal protein [Bryobacteraceae bacterium]